MGTEDNYFNGEAWEKLERELDEDAKKLLSGIDEDAEKLFCDEEWEALMLELKELEQRAKTIFP